MITFAESQQTKVREEVKEMFFAAGNRILRPIVQVLNEVYPSSKRLRSSPSFSQEIFDEHDQKFRRARNHLYEQRNLVFHKWLPRYIIKTQGGDSVATTEFRNVIVAGALDRLYETLIAYMPMLVPASQAQQLMLTVKNMYEIEARQLSAALEKYEATFAPNVIAIDADYE